VADGPLPEKDHVLRYIGRRHVDRGIISGSGFLTRPAEDRPSVNWIECFPPPTLNQVAEISARRRLRYERNALLVRLNVCHTKQYVSSNAPIPIEIDFLHDPLAVENGWSEDPSHAVIEGVPTIETPEGELIKDLFVDCIVERFPVAPDR
jgi:hypothetical protein